MKVSALDGLNRINQESMLNIREKNIEQEGNSNSLQLDQHEKNKVVITEEEVIKTIENANKSLELAQTRLEFSIHDQTKEIMVKVLNKETGELIREIPPEKILDMVAHMWKLAGIIVDEKV